MKNIFSLYLRNTVPYYQAVAMGYADKLDWQAHYRRLSYIIYSVGAGSMHLQHNNDLYWVYNVPPPDTLVMYRIKI